MYDFYSSCLQELSLYDIHNEYKFYFVLCAGQELSVFDFVNCENARIKVK